MLDSINSQGNTYFHSESSPNPNRRQQPKPESPILSYTPFRGKKSYDPLALSHISTVSTNIGSETTEKGYSQGISPYKINDYRSESQNRSRLSVRSNQHSSISPTQLKKYGTEVSTASSTNSGYSRHNNNNTVYSFESSLSSSAMDRFKFAKNNHLKYVSPVETRIQSAQPQGEMGGLPFMGDKRTYSAAEKPVNESPFQNRLSQKLRPGGNQEVYLEYSVTKGLEEFGTYNFEPPVGVGSTGYTMATLDPPNEYNSESKKIPSYQDFNKTHLFNPDSLPSIHHEAKIKKAPQNPYRNGKPELTQRVKQLQATFGATEMEEQKRKSQFGSTLENTVNPEGRTRNALSTQHYKSEQIYVKLCSVCDKKLGKG